MKAMKPSLITLMFSIWLFAVPAWSVDYTWTGAGGDDRWVNANNWVGGAGGEFPDDVNDRAIINVTTGMTGPVVTLDAIFTIGQLEVNYTSGTFNIQILSGGGLTVQNNGPSSPWLPNMTSITVDNGASLTLGSSIRRSAKLGTNFDIAGTVTVSGGTFEMFTSGGLDPTGLITVNNGTVNLETAVTFSTATGSQIIVNDGNVTFNNDAHSLNGVLDINGGTVDFLVSTQTSIFGGFDVGGGTTTFNGPTQLSTPGVASVTNGNVNFNGPVSQFTTFNLSGGQASLADPFTFTNDGNFNLSGGTFNVEGDFTNSNGNILWTGGIWTGAGGESTNPSSIGSFTIDGAATKTLDNHILKHNSFSTLNLQGTGVLQIVNGGQFYNEGTASWTGDGNIEVNDTSLFSNGFDDGMTTPMPGTLNWQGNGLLRLLGMSTFDNASGTFNWETSANLEIDLNAQFTNRDFFNHTNTGQMIAGPNGAGVFENTASFTRTDPAVRFNKKRMPGPLAEIFVFFDSQTGSSVTCELGTLVFHGGGDFSNAVVTSQDSAMMTADQAIEFAGGNFSFSDTTIFAGDQGWIFSGGVSTFTASSIITFPAGTFFRFSGGELVGNGGGFPISLNIQSTDFTIEGNNPKAISGELEVAPTDPMVQMSGDGDLTFDDSGSLRIFSDFLMASDADFFAGPSIPDSFSSLVVGSIFNKTMGVGAGDPTIVNVEFSFNGGLDVDTGVLELASAGSIDGDHNVDIGATLEFSNGVVTLSDTVDALVTLQGDGTFLLGSGSEASLQNNGELLANANLLIDNGRLGITSEFSIRSGGNLEFISGEIGPPTMVVPIVTRGTRTLRNDLGGTLEFSNVSPIQISNLVIDNQGNLDWTGTGDVDLRDNSAISNNMNFDISNEARMLSGTGDSGVTNNSSLIKSMTQNAANLTTFEVPVTSTMAASFQVTSGTLALAEDSIISGPLGLGDGNNVDPAAEFKVINAVVTVNGTVMDNDANSSNVTVEMGTLIVNNSFNIGGTLEVNSGGTFDMNGLGTNNGVANLTLAGDLVDMANLTISNQFTWNSGSITGHTSGTPFDGTTPPPTPDLITVIGAFDYAATAATTLDNIDMLVAGASNQNGAGTLTLNGIGTFFMSEPYVMAGGTTLALGAGANHGVDIGTALRMLTPGTATVGAPIELSGGFIQINVGTLNLTEALDIDTGVGNNAVFVSGGGDLQVPGGMNVSSGTVGLRESSSITGNITLTGGTLQGAGTVNGNVDNQSGTISPESVSMTLDAKREIGELHIKGTFTQGSTGILAIEIEEVGTNIFDFDTLLIDDGMLDGTVDLTFVGNQPVPDREGYPILAYNNSVTGNFATVALPMDANPGLTATTEDDGINQISLIFGGPAAASWTGAGDGTTFSDPGNWLNNERPAYNTATTINASGGANAILDQDYEVFSLDLGSNAGSDTQRFDLNGQRFAVEGDFFTFGNGQLVLSEGSVLTDSLVDIVFEKQSKRKGTNALGVEGEMLVQGDASVELADFNVLVDADIRLMPVSAAGAVLTVPGFTNLGRIEFGIPADSSPVGLDLTGTGVLNNQGSFESVGVEGNPPVRTVFGNINNTGLVAMQDVHLETTDFFNNTGSVLEGNGTIEMTGSGPDAIRLGGQVVPSSGITGMLSGRGGPSTGEFRFIGPTLLQSDLMLEMDVLGLSDLDRIVIEAGSQIVFDGSLLTRFDGPIDVEIEDRFELITFGSGLASGDFASVEVPPTTNGVDFVPDVLDTSYGIVFEAITPLTAPALFVIDPDNGTGIVYDPIDNSFVSTLRGFGDLATLHFSTDGSVAYLLSEGSNQVDILDTSTLQFTDTITGLGIPYDLAANGDNSQLWVIEDDGKGGAQIRVVEVASGSLLSSSTPCVNDPRLIVYDSAADRFFVLGQGGDGCTYNANDPDTSVDTFSFGGIPADVQITANGEYLAISQSVPDDGTLELISYMNLETFDFDSETALPVGQMAGRFDTTVDSEVAVSGSADTVFKVDATSGSTKRLDITDTIVFSGAMGLFGVAYDEENGVLFATDPTVGDTFFDDGVMQGTLVGPPDGAFNFVPTFTGINKDRSQAPLDPGFIDFAQADLGAFDEDSGTVNITVNRIGGTNGSLTAQIQVGTGSTATAGVDFILNTSTVTFPNGSSTAQTVSVGIIDDELVEGSTPEVVELFLDGDFIGELSQTRFEIVDNDEDVVTGPNALALGQENFVAAEGGTIQVPIIRSGDGIGRVTATLEALANTAVPRADYAFQSQGIIFDDGEVGTRIVDIQIVDDNFVERQENFQLSLQSITGIPAGTTTTATVVINDNDVTEVTWTSASTRIAETTNKRDANVTVTAQLSEPASFVVNVPFTVGGTAVPGEDHGLNSGTLSFAPGATEADVAITVFGDNVLEPDETVILTLTGTEVPIGTPSIHTITIQNDDFNIVEVNTQILNLPENNRFVDGQLVQLQAQGTGGAGGPYTYVWEICNAALGCETYSGEFIAPVFPEPGFYIVVARATDNQGNTDATPAQVRIEIVEDLPPVVEIGFPEDDQLNLPAGAQQLFVAIAEDNNDDVRLEWFVSNRRSQRFPGREFLTRFPDPGTYIVVVEAIDSAGQVASDSVRVDVTDAPTLPVVFEIASPSRGSVFQVNESIRVDFNFQAGSSKKAFDFFLDINGSRVVADQNGATVRYTRPGRYFLRAFAVDGDRRYESSVQVFVREPNRPPVVDILPTTNITLDLSANPNPGVFFSGLVTENNGFGELNYFWDFGNGMTSLQRVPGRIPYDEVGTYQVTMFARTPNGLETAPVTRTIVVMNAMQGRWEPNDTLGQAPTLNPGGYGNLVLNDDSPVDTYKFEVKNLGQRVSLRFIPTAPIIVDIYNEAEELVRSDELNEGQTLQYTGLEAGFYFCQMRPVEAFTKKFVSLSYSLAIDVLNPAMYFTEVSSNEVDSTELGLVNLSNDNTSVELVGYDGSGSEVAAVEFNLNGSGRINQSVEGLFGREDSREIRWVQVNATNKLEGYSRVGTTDGRERYAVSGSKRLSSRLFVPHIAEGVNQWFTRASVVNGTSAGTDANIQTPNDQRNLALTEGFAADQFDILDRFNGELESNIWALFENSSADAVLAGSEVFGTIDDEIRIVAGLELIDNEQDDPAFTYVANTLFFTHIASDVNNFWTGLALVNTGEFIQGYRVKGYTGDGELLLDKTGELMPFQKLVQVAETFLSPRSPAEIEWVEVEADSQIVGFELFGTHNNKTMAGLEATNVLKNDICVPYIDATGQAIHGISIINPNDQENEIELMLYSDEGEKLFTEPVKITLAANVKMSQTLRQMFPDQFNIGSNAIPGWLEIKGDFPLAGFQLIFEGEGEQMSGLIAR